MFVNLCKCVCMHASHVCPYGDVYTGCWKSFMRTRATPLLCSMEGRSSFTISRDIVRSPHGPPALETSCRLSLAIAAMLSQVGTSSFTVHRDMSIRIKAGIIMSSFF